MPSAVPRLVGVVHLPPLPGSPRYGGSMSSVRERARADAVALAAAGFDAILVENFGDAPFFPDRVPAETTAAMSVVAADVRSACDLPLGINVLRNDAHAALAVCAAAGASFVRVNVHTGARLCDQGIVQGRAHETLRLRRALGLERVELWCDVDVKHSAPLAARSLEEEAMDATERAMADVLLVTGARTGGPASLDEVLRLQAVTATPVAVASGVTAGIVGDVLAHASAVIVGSDLRASGRAGDPVDPARAAAFVTAARAAGGRR